MSDDDRPSSAAPLLLVLLGAFLVAVLLAGGAGFYFYRQARDAEMMARMKAEEARAAAERQQERIPGDPTRDAPRAAVGEPVTIDGLTVKVVSAEVGRAKLYLDEKRDEFVEDKDPSLLVRVELSAANKAKKFGYSTWRSLQAPPARDDLGNTYLGKLWALRSEAPDWLTGKALYDGDRAVDTLAFQRPVEAAKFIDIDLPGKNASVDGTFRFRIPRVAWEKK